MNTEAIKEALEDSGVKQFSIEGNTLKIKGDLKECESIDKLGMNIEVVGDCYCVPKNLNGVGGVLNLILKDNLDLGRVSYLYNTEIVGGLNDFTVKIGHPMGSFIASNMNLKGVEAEGDSMSLRGNCSLEDCYLDFDEFNFSTGKYTFKNTHLSSKESIELDMTIKSKSNIVIREADSVTVRVNRLLDIDFGSAETVYLNVDYNLKEFPKYTGTVGEVVLSGIRPGKAAKKLLGGLRYDSLVDAEGDDFDDYDEDDCDEYDY